jgi:hypothetical protein
MKTRQFLVMVVCTGLLLGACSGDEEPTADAEYFAGLDRTVVAEVLKNPVAQERVSGDSQEDKEMRLQGSVINFIVCRDLHRVYKTWLSTGTAPKPNPLPTPSKPRIDWANEFSAVLQAAESGDPDNLRQVLTGPGTCGEWIPANPGDTSGQTIKDAIEAMS